jgi:hypothetical protein
MMRAIVALLLIVAWATPSRADDDSLGGPGESCRARADCKHGLKCLANKCVDEHDGESCGATSECGTLKCIDNKCVNILTLKPPPQTTQQQPPVQAVQTPTPPQATSVQTPTVVAPPSHAWQDWVNFRSDGLHPFVGITLAGGPLTAGYTASEGSLWGSGADGVFLLGLRGGVLINNRHELAVEISPFTYFWDLHTEPGPAFQMNATYAYFIPLFKSSSLQLSWPLRFGVGFFAGGSNTNSSVFFQARADLVDLALRTGHVIIDLHAPSFRYGLTNGHVDGVAVEGVTTNVLTFLFGASVSYLF